MVDRICWSLVCVLGISPLAAVTGQEHSNSAEHRWYDTIAEAKPDDQVRKAITTFAQRASGEQLHDAIKSDNTSLAVQARWQLFRTIGAQTKGAEDNANFARLIGWIEGRLGLECPDRWRFSVLYYHTKLSEEVTQQVFRYEAKRLPELFEMVDDQVLLRPLSMERCKNDRSINYPRGRLLGLKDQSLSGCFFPGIRRHYCHLSDT